METFPAPSVSLRLDTHVRVVPPHGRGEAGKGQGHCTRDSHINSMMLRPSFPDALSTPIREQDQGAPTHSSRATAALPLHPLLLMAGVLKQKLLLAVLLSPCHDFGHLSHWQQQNNPQASRGSRTPLTDGASQSKLQLTPHKQAEERPGLFPTQIPSAPAAQAPREPLLSQAQTQPHLSGAESR